jgi:hypothetical protein
MDKPSPNNPHMHDWLGTQSMGPKPFESMAFDPKQMMDGLSAAGMGPMKALTIQQMELMTFFSRRAQAYLGLPQRMSRCRTSADLVNEQMRFWQTAMSQYQDASTRIASAWSDAFASLPTGAGAGAGGVVFPKTGSAVKSERQPPRKADVIRMPNGRE